MYKTPEGIPIYEENDRLRIVLSILSGRRTIADLDEEERFVLSGRLCLNEHYPPPLPETDEGFQILVEEILYDRFRYKEENNVFLGDLT